MQNQENLSCLSWISNLVWFLVCCFRQWVDLWKMYECTEFLGLKVTQSQLQGMLRKLFLALMSTGDVVVFFRENCSVLFCFALFVCHIEILQTLEPMGGFIWYRWKALGEEGCSTFILWRLDQFWGIYWILKCLWCEKWHGKACRLIHDGGHHSRLIWGVGIGILCLFCKEYLT